MIGSQQKKTLLALGWKEVDEEGAVLYHPDASALACNRVFLWSNQTFADALEMTRRAIYAGAMSVLESRRATSMNRNHFKYIEKPFKSMDGNS